MVEKVQPTGVLPGEGLTVGVLALQGGVSEHAEMLDSLGAQAVSYTHLTLPTILRV